MSWGTKKSVFIEDCVFSAPRPLLGRWGVTDGDTGGRFVVRHCVCNNMALGSHGADSQPPENGQNANKSILQMEVMHNTMTFSEGVDFVFYIRGGSAVFFDNKIGGSSTAFVNHVLKLGYYRSVAGNGVCAVDRAYPADYIGTQQPGSGVVSSPGQDPRNPTEPWGSVPIYSWDNPVTIAANVGFAGSESVFAQANRDFFDNKQMPGYTEFVYPHPLQTGAPVSSLSAPSNVRVNP